MKERSRRRRGLQRHRDELAGLYGIVREVNARMRLVYLDMSRFHALRLFAAHDYVPGAL